MRNRVVFPEPSEPTNPVIVPRFILADNLDKAGVASFAVGNILTILSITIEIFSFNGITITTQLIGIKTLIFSLLQAFPDEIHGEGLASQSATDKPAQCVNLVFQLFSV